MAEIKIVEGEMGRLVKAGAYRLSEHQYHADPCPEPSLSCSLAKVLLAASPKQAAWEHPRLNPKWEPGPSKKHMELGSAWQVVEDSAVQGNLDPCVLLSSRDYLRKRAEEILKQVGKRPGHVFNLGHGIMPQTPEENVTALVEFVHEISEKLRR